MEKEYVPAQIPPRFLAWMVESRRQLLDELEQGRQVRYFSAHLPVIASWTADGSFPVNLSVKGIGLVPRESLLSDFIREFEDVYEHAREKGWGESFPKRSEALRRLYADPELFDAGRMGGLEIFEGRTLENLKALPRISLLFMGMLPQPKRMSYLSFQVNGEVDICPPGDPYHRFLLAARRLFEFDRFHLPQNDYPLAYVIRVSEVLDKSPFIKEGK
jgi:hypothetical protein